MDNNGIYNTNKTITFNEGTATLDGQIFASGGSAGEGVHTLIVTDTAGNVRTISFRIDKTAPTTTISYSTTDPVNGNVVTTLNPSEGVTVTNNGGATTYTFTENGSFTFEFRDAAGNTGSAVATVNNIDKTAPIAAISYSTTDLTNGNVIATLNPSEGVTVTNNEGKTTYTFTGNGSFTFEFRDAAGNIGSVVATVGNIDKTAPTATVSYNTTEPSNGDAVATLNPSESVTVTNNEGKATYTFTQNGSFTFEFRDAAGNTGSTVATVVNIDKTAPTATVSYSTTDPTNMDVVATLNASESVTVTNNEGKITYTFTGNGSFTFEFIDAAGNTGSVVATVGNIDKTAPTATVSYSTTDPANVDVVATFNASESVTVTNNEGKTTYTFTGNGSFTFEFRDAAGNTSSAVATVGNIDKTSPTATVSYSTTDPTNVDVVATLNPSESVTVTNNEGKTTYTFTGNGSFTFEFRDAAGNTSSAVATVGNIDKTSPTATVSYSTTDPTNVDVVATLNASESVTVTNNEGKTTYTFTDNGSFTFEFIDAAGNTGSVVATVGNIDKTAPTATVSYNTTAPSNGDVVATLNPSESVTVTNNEGKATYTFTQNGSFTFEFRDAAGNTGSTVTTVSNIDKTIPVVTGLVDNEIYNTDQTINFNEGIALLDGQPVTSGNKAGEGVHTLVVRDAAGNVRTINFTVDKTVPIATVSYSVTGPTNGDVVATLNPSESVTVTNNAGETSYTFTENGNFTFEFRDVAGNTGSVLATVYNIDKAVPIATISYSTIDPTNGNVVTTLNPSESVTVTNNGGATTYTFTDNGSFTFEFRDAAGNTGSLVATVNNIDKSIPIVTGVEDNGIYNTDITITFNEGTATLNGNPLTSGSSITDEGLYNLIVRDMAGNFISSSFNIDKTAPAASIVINSGDTHTTTPVVSLSITYSDGKGSGVSYMRFSEDGSNWSPWESAAPVKPYIITGGYGITTIYMQLKDIAGNINENIAGSITYKSVPHSSDGSKSGREDETLQFTVSDFVYSNADGSKLNKIIFINIPDTRYGTLILKNTQASVSQDVYSNISVLQDVYSEDLGNIVFMPNKNWYGITSFTWKVSDGIQYSDESATMTIIIESVNDVPISSNGTIETNAEMPGNGELTSVDADGDILNYNIVSQGTKGTAVITDINAGKYTYLPNDGAYGDDNFTFKTYDGLSDSNEATMYVKIIPAGVADLKALSVDVDSITPEFSPNTMDYSISVSNEVYSLTVSASVYDRHSTVVINGISVTDSVYGNVKVILPVGISIIPVKVTAQDGITTKTYYIKATRAASNNVNLGSLNIIGVDCKLEEIQGKLIYRSDVPNGSVVIDLAEGSNTIIIEVIAEDKISMMSYTLIVQREISFIEDNPYPSSSQEENKTKSTGVDILVNGQVETAATAYNRMDGDKTITTVVVDEKKLEQKLEKEGNNAMVTIPVAGNSDVTIGELNGQMVKNMEQKSATLEVRTSTASYILPAHLFKIDDVSTQIGADIGLKDIKVQIEISKTSDETVKIVENAANKGEFSIVAPIIDFMVKCTYDDKTVEVIKFNEFVVRTIAIPEGTDPKKITTGVVVEKDGSVRHVPTKIIIIDGKYYAQINSLTNSSYSIIWHPKEFGDLLNHWAKEYVNEMGARLVIKGVNENTFEPDRDITRAEFAAIVVRALGLGDGETIQKFSDVKYGDWFMGSVATASEYGIINGYQDGTFKPDRAITREEAMAMIARAIKLAKMNTNISDSEALALLAKFEDGKDVDNWVKQSAAACIKNDIVVGRNKGLEPDENITRAETATIVLRMLQKAGLI